MSANLSARERVVNVLLSFPGPMNSASIFAADDNFEDRKQVGNALFQLTSQGYLRKTDAGYTVTANGKEKFAHIAAAPPPKAAAKPAQPAAPATRPAVPARDVLAEPGGTSAPAGQPDDDHEARLEPFLRPAPAAVPAPPADFDAAIRLDGTLTISDGDATVELNAVQCARLLKFLEAHA